MKTTNTKWAIAFLLLLFTIHSKAQFSFVGGANFSDVLSGTFGFTACDPLTKVPYGRFDFRISKDYNFQKIEEITPP